MESQGLPQSFIIFSKSIFFLGKRYYERNTAKEELFQHISKIKKASLSRKQKNVVRALEKIEAKIITLIDKEKKLLNLSLVSNEEVAGLKNRMVRLEQELLNEREAKIALLLQNKNKVKEFTLMLNSIKSRLRHYVMEKEKRKMRLKSLHKKISREI